MLTERFFKKRYKLRNNCPLLLSRIAVAHRYVAIVERVKVHGNAKRRADFVLSAVSFADVAIVVEHDGSKFSFEHGEYFPRLLHQRWFVLEKREHGDFYRGHCRFEL